MPLQWGQQTASSAGQYASNFISSPAAGLPDIKALEDAEPHYGTHAVQRSAASLLDWLQAQSAGKSTIGTLVGSAGIEIRKPPAHISSSLVESLQHTLGQQVQEP